MVNLFTYLHELFMFAAVAVSAGGGMILHSIAHSGEPRVIAAAFSRSRALMAAIPGLYVGGVVFGIVTAILGGYNLLAPWLIATYVLVVLSILLGSVVVGRWARTLAIAAAKIAEAGADAEFTSLATSRAPLVAAWLNIASLALIILLMVFKPFG